MVGTAFLDWIEWITQSHQLKDKKENLKTGNNVYVSGVRNVHFSENLLGFVFLLP